MRILHVTDTFAPTLGGIEVFVEDLARRQARAGHQVAVLTPGADSVPSGVTEFDVVRDPSRLHELVAGADAVHGHVSVWSPLAYRGVESAARQGIPAVATVHSMWHDFLPALRIVARARKWSSLPVVWAAVSEPAADPVRRALGGGDVLVLPNAIDVGGWLPPTDRGVRPVAGPVRILSVMRMARRKRPDAAVDVLARARSMVPPSVRLEATLVGDGPQLPRLRHALRARGMDQWVSTPGRLTRDEVRDLCHASDVFLSPTVHESFGIAALEARTAGMVVLGREGTGIGDFVTSGVDGLLSGSDDHQARQLATVCRNPRILSRMLSHSRGTVPSYDWSDVLGRNEIAYALAGAAGHRTAASAAPGVRARTLSTLSA